MTRVKSTIGNWTGEILTDGKAPQLVINGEFPTNGERPLFNLRPAVPQGFNPRILMLILEPEGLIDSNGTGTGIVHYTQILPYITRFSSVVILQENYSVLADINFDHETNEYFQEASEPEFKGSPTLETLKALEVKDGKLKIRVYSGGCTSIEDFEVVANGGFTGQEPFMVHIYRKRQDFCEMYLPDGIELEWTLSDFGILPNHSVFVYNPIFSGM